MKLFINTTISKKAIVSLIDGEKIIATEEADEPLLAIDRLLKKTKIKLADLEEISSHPGPGSFTGLRVGAAVANALNFALGKKVGKTHLKYE
jgi:tRNA threonylcarbamoyladenosine biosynthesis protein TsaB